MNLRRGAANWLSAEDNTAGSLAGSLLRDEVLNQAVKDAEKDAEGKGAATEKKKGSTSDVHVSQGRRAR